MTEQTTTDDAQVRALVATYVQGCTDADAAAVASVFADDARMWGWLGDQYLSVPIAAFFDVVRESADNPDRTAGYAHQIVDVVVRPRVAVVTFEEQGYLGADFTTTFTAVKTDGVWKVVSKTFATVS